MSKYFNLQLKSQHQPIVIIANSQNDAFKQALREGQRCNSQIISLAEVFIVDVRRRRK